MLEPFPRRFDGTHLFFAGLFVVDGSVGKAACNGIGDRPKQMNHGSEFLFGQSVEQGVGLLAFLGNVSSHRFLHSILNWD